MKIKTGYEKFIHWDNVTDNFPSIDVTTTLELGGSIAKPSDSNDSCLITIEYRFRIYPRENTNAIFSGIVECLYEVFPEKNKTTIEDFALIYKKPYLLLKSRFDNEKRGTFLEPIQVPDFRQDSKWIQDGFHLDLPALGLL